MVQTLKRGSEVLRRLQESFESILEHFAIYTLIEDIGYPKVGKIVSKESAIMGRHEETIHMLANHCDMVKFGEHTESGYKRGRRAISEIIKDRIEGLRPQTNGMLTVAVPIHDANSPN